MQLVSKDNKKVKKMITHVAYYSNRKYTCKNKQLLNFNAWLDIELRK